jgi:hypothetical protein
MADVGQAVFRAIADFSRIRREAKRTSRGLEDLRDETRDVNREFERTKRAAEAATEGLDEAGDEARGTARQLRGLAREGNATQRALLGAARAAHAFGAAVRRSPVGRFAGWLSQVRQRALDAGVDLDRLDRSVDRVGKSFLAAAGGVAKLAAVLGGLALLTGAVHATAAGVLSLLGALGALSGSLGVLPGLLAAAGVATAALKIGTAGFGDAIKAVVEGDLEKFKESVQGLAPSARRTAWAIWELRPALKSLRDSVQQVLFFEFADRVRRLGQTYLPLADRALTSVAASFNTAAKRVADFLLGAERVRDVEGILDDVAAGFHRLDSIAENVVAAFLDIGAVSADFLPGLSDGLDDATAAFRRFIRQARESGRLAEWIQDGIDATKRLGSVLVNLGATLYGVFKAGDRVGANFLETLDRLTERMSTFVNSARGQRALGSFFLSARRAGEALLPVLAAIVATFGDKIAPVLAAISERLGPGLVDVVEGLGAAFDNAGPALVVFFDAVSELLSALGSAGPLIGDLAAGLGAVLIPALYALAGLIRAVTAVWNSLPAPVQAVIGVFGGAALAAGGLVLALYKVIKTARKVKAALATIAAVTGFGRAGGAAAGTAAGAAAQRGLLARFGRGLKGRLGSILETALLGMMFFPGAVGRIATKAKGAFTGGFKGTAPAATGIMSRVGNAVKGVGPKAVAAAGKLKYLRLAFSTTPWGLAINGLLLAGTAVWTHWDSVVAGVKSAWDGTVSFFQGLGPRIQGAWSSTTSWLAGLPGQAQSAVSGMGTWFDKLPGRVGYAAGYAGGWVVREIGEMKDSTIARTAALVLGAGNWFSKLPSRLGNLARQTGTGVKNWFRDMRDRTVADTSTLLVRTGDFFSKLPGRLGSFARSAGTATKNAFRDMKDRAVADTAALGMRTVDIIRGLPGKIRGFASGFFSAGADLARGLWNGIKSMAGRVASAAVDMVVGAIAGAKAAAREGSPSKVFRDIGLNIGEGLALGIERMRDRVLGVVRDLIGRLAAAFGRGGLGARITEQFRNLPDKVVLGAVSAGTWERLKAAGWRGDPTDRQEALYRPAAPAVTRGQLMARALPPDTGGTRFTDVGDQINAIARVMNRRAGQQTSRDVSVSFGDIVNPVPEPASDTAARKLRTLALMGAFG